MRASTKINFDLYLAILALLLGIGSSVFAYASILQLEAPTHIIFSNITLGQNQYTIENQGKCVGHIFSQLEKNNTYYLTSQGQLNTKLSRQDLQANFNLEASFNPLGQLNGAEIKLTTSQSSLTLKSVGANPIILSVTARFMDRAFSHDFEIPGPLVLNKHSSKTYQIEYRHLKTSAASTLPIFANLVPSIDLKILPTTATQPCLNSTQNSLDLMPLVIQMQNFITPLTNLIPAPATDPK